MLNGKEDAIMEELVNSVPPGAVEATTSTVGNFLSNSGNMFGTGVIGALLLAIGMIFFNWKASSNKPIKARKVEYKELKSEIASEIVANQDKQAEVKATFENKVELTRVQEVKIEKIVEKATSDIKATMAEKDPRVTVNNIISKWKRNGK